MKSLSAHGDQDDLARFIRCQDTKKVKKVFLVHSEYLVQQELSPRLNRRGFTNIEMPLMYQEFELECRDIMLRFNSVLFGSYISYFVP